MNNLKQMIGAEKKLPLEIHGNVAKNHFETRGTGLKSQIISYSKVFYKNLSLHQ